MILNSFSSILINKFSNISTSRSLFASCLNSSFSSNSSCYFSTFPSFESQIPSYFNEEDIRFYNNLPSDAVPISEVQSVVVESGKYCSAKRCSPIPQLKCVGGTAKNYSNLYPTNAQCLNQGWDGENYNWKLQSELDNSVKFGNFELIYEGYRYPGDPQYALKGSWALEYNLDFRDSNSNSNSNYFWNNWFSKPDEIHKVEIISDEGNGFWYFIKRIAEGIIKITIFSTILGVFSIIIIRGIILHRRRRRLRRLLLRNNSLIYDVNRENPNEVFRELERIERKKNRNFWRNLFFYNWIFRPRTHYVYPYRSWYPWNWGWSNDDPYNSWYNSSYYSPPQPRRRIVRETHVYHNNNRNFGRRNENNDNDRSVSSSFGKSRGR